ncbi:unnamed protein product [marine sediment metagenome]|uniref:Uncharacterized protein n=1 Tax=marine sediment metagenome TaxID=412755 RepID=X1AB28_9ZZZZ
MGAKARSSGEGNPGFRVVPRMSRSQSDAGRTRGFTVEAKAPIGRRDRRMRVVTNLEGATYSEGHMYPCGDRESEKPPTGVWERARNSAPDRIYSVEAPKRDVLGATVLAWSRDSRI